MTSPNLLVNPGAEAAAGSADGRPVAVPGWTVKGPFTAVKWGAACPGGCPTASAYPNGGAYLLAGGVNNASSIATIGWGGRQVWVGAALGGWEGQHDAATVRAIFFGKDGKPLGTATIGGDTFAARKGATALVTLGRKMTVPAGTRTIRVAMIAKRTDGAFNDAYFDDLVLKFVS